MLALTRVDKREIKEKRNTIDNKSCIETIVRIKKRQKNNRRVGGGNVKRTIKILVCNLVSIQQSIYIYVNIYTLLKFI